MNINQTDIVIPITLLDTSKPGKSKKLERKAVVRINSLGIAIAVEGYGDAGTMPGHGEPIFIEFYNGTLRVCLNTDINHEDPHVIDMEGALESKREVL